MSEQINELMSPLVLQGPPSASRRGVDPAAFQGTGAVSYPALPVPGNETAQGYSAYPEIAEVSQSTPASQQTELFMDYYSDVSRYCIP